MPMSSRLIKSAPSLTKSPTLMLRMPTTPLKGATMRMRSKRAHDKLTCASETCKLAALSSKTLWATKFCDTKSWLRLWLALAIESCASDCCTSARCKVSSSCTSTWPTFTRAPSPNPNDKIRPATSGRIITFWRERKVPTASASSRNNIFLTLTNSTPTALPPAPPGTVIPMEDLLAFWYHQATVDAVRMPATATMV